MRLIKTLSVANELGEGVIWDHQNQKLWWTDIQGSALYRYDPESEELEQWQTPERLACFAAREGKAEHELVCAFESGFAFYSPVSETLEWIKKLESNNPGTRFNDGRTDRQGRFWAGTMIEDQDNASYKGSLYCLNTDLIITKTIGDLSIPNSLCWSPYGKTMYHTDTPTLEINQYDFDIDTGRFGQAKTFVKTKHGCYPDGSIVDSQGGLWNAQWGSSKVVRYTESGTQDLVVDVPATQPSCVAFGGKHLNLLFVTSAWQGMSPEARAADPQAGNLFIYQTSFKGLIERGFAGQPEPPKP